MQAYRKVAGVTLPLPYDLWKLWDYVYLYYYLATAGSIDVTFSPMLTSEDQGPWTLPAPPLSDDLRPAKRPPIHSFGDSLRPVSDEVGPMWPSSSSPRSHLVAEGNDVTPL